jgi:alpha-tubulin suppressor-like RCC1 family protein
LVLFATLVATSTLGLTSGNSAPFNASEPLRRSIAAGDDYTLIIKSDGSLWAWGNNVSGQLGDGTREDKTVPFRVGQDTNWLAVTATFWHVLALKADGTIWAWGSNGFGQLGDGTFTARYVPTQVGVDRDWADVAAGNSWSSAIKSNGTLWGWGDNGGGELGIGTSDTGSNVPVQAGTFTNWVTVSAGTAAVAALQADGTAWKWGQNWVWVQTNVAKLFTTPSPTPLDNSTSWKVVTAGDMRGAGIRSDGTLWTWGAWNQDPLGPALQVGQETNWVTVSSAAADALAIKSDGTLWAWGDNSAGQLGDGTLQSRLLPVQVGAGKTWVVCAAGLDHSLALDDKGGLWAWGNNVVADIHANLITGILGTRDLSPVVTSPAYVFNTIATAPTISLIPDQSPSVGEVLGPIPFTISDPVTPLSNLALSAESSDPTVIRPEDVILGGTAGQRTLTLSAKSSQVGTTKVTVHVSDGLLQEQTSFLVKVRPANDDWENATPLSGLDVVVSGSNTNATLQPGEPSHSPFLNQTNNASVWWSWTSAINASTSISIDGSFSGAELAVYTGNSLATLQPVPFGPNASTRQLQIQSVAGQTYWITVDGSFGTTGDIVLSVHAVPRNLPPTIMGLPLGVLPGGNPVGPFSFTVNDFETAASNLVVTATSSNPNLVPEANIMLVGAGSNRTLSVTPIAGQTGIAAITVQATDADGATASASFGVWVLDPGLARGQIAAGGQHLVILKPDGTLWALGNNSSGQLGDGTFQRRLAPVRVGQGTNWTAVAARGNHTVALQADGTLWAWGQYVPGVQTNLPTQIGTDTDWARIAAGADHTLALKADGSLWAFGANNAGQLGNGTGIDSPSPVQVGTSPDWAVIRAGSAFSLAIKKDGTLWSWGVNFNGQLGNGTDGVGTVANLKPQPVVGNSRWQAVSAGGDHVLALASDGTLWAWGNGLFGQLGNGATLRAQDTPVQVTSETGWVDVVAGFGDSAAIKADGTLWTWGSNLGGQLGDGNLDSKSVPTQVPGSSNWVAVVAPAAGAVVGPPGSITGTTTYVSGLKTDGSLWVWGFNDNGQLGQATFAGYTGIPTPIADTNWANVFSGASAARTLAIKTDGTLWNWGEPFPGVDTPSPTRLTTASNWISGSLGHYDSAALRTDQTLWTWGDNTAGQLGFWTSSGPGGPGTWVASPSPVPGAGYSVVAGSAAHFTALKADGTLWSLDEIGFGNGAPEQLGQDTDWIALAAGGSSTAWNLALKSDGSLWGWNVPAAPARIGGDNDWRVVAVGAAQNLAIKSNGTLWVWGANDSGQLGDGTTVTRYEPLQIGTNANWTAVAGGGAHSVALQADGSLWAWGANCRGQLGDGTMRDARRPRRIGLSTNWVRIAAGSVHTAALRADGTLWTWGDNSLDQLGNGISGKVATPQLMLNLTDAPPSLSGISDQFTWQDTPLGPLALSVADPDRPLSDLKIWAFSSDGSVVQPDGISFSGSEAQRTLTVVPMPGATGRTTITLMVSDGSLSDRTSFELEVGPHLASGSSQLEVKLSSNGGGLELALHGEAGQQYAIEVSADLQAWTLLQNVTLSQPGYTWSQEPSAGQRFYRARTAP